MSSQASQGWPVVGPLTHRLLKFSYATVSETSTGPIPWIHLADKNDLFAVFEVLRVHNYSGTVVERKQLKVLKDPEILEQIDIGLLAGEAQKEIKQARIENVVLQAPKVAIIVRTPCIAIKYPVAQGQVRRFQMRFVSNVDYFSAVGLFAAVEAPLTEAGSFPTYQPNSRPFSSSSLLHPNDSASQINISPPSQLSRASSTFRDISTSSRRGIVPDQNRPLTASSGMMGPPSLSIAHGALPSLNPDQPLAGNGISSVQQVNLISQQLSPSECVTRDTEDKQNFRSLGQSGEYTRAGSPLKSCPSATLQPSHSPHYTTSSTSEQHQPVTNLCEPRPSTAPALQGHNLSQILPPRRELPFIKKPPQRGLRTSAPRNTRPGPTPPSSSTSRLSAQTCPAALSFQSFTNEWKGSSCAAAPPADGPTATPQAKRKAVHTQRTTTRGTKKPAASRLRTTAAPVVEEIPVPSVEDLIKKSQQSTQKIAAVSNSIDTQALLLEVERRHRSASLLSNKENTAPVLAGRDAVEVNQLGHHHHDHHHHQHCESLVLSQIPHRSPNLDTSINNPIMSQIRTNTTAIEVNDSQDRRQPCCTSQDLQVDPAVSQDTSRPPLRDGSPDLGGGSLEERSFPNSSASPSKAVPAGLNTCTPALEGPRSGSRLSNVSTLAALWQASSTTSARPESLVQWANLAEGERHAALETFICQQIQDENFTKLVLQIEPVWQRVFLGL